MDRKRARLRIGSNVRSVTRTCATNGTVCTCVDECV